MTPTLSIPRSLRCLATLTLCLAALGLVQPVAGAELPITNGLAVWLKADAIDTGDPSQVRTDGGSLYVMQWNDQSSNDQHATQATETNQPEYIAGDLNGYPVLKWDGTDKFMRGPADTTIQTLFFVCKVDGSVGYQGMFCQSPDVDSQNIYGDGNNWNMGYNAAYFDNENTNATRINGVATYTHNGLWHILRMVSATTPSFTYQLSQGAYDRFFNGRIAELIVFNRTLDDEEATAVEVYLSRKYWGDVHITNTPFTVTAGDSIKVAGTNSGTIVGDMWISNAANDEAASFPASNGWVSPGVLSVTGDNIVWVYGANSAGYVVGDMIVVTGVPEPAAAAAAVIGSVVFAYRIRLSAPLRRRKR